MILVHEKRRESMDNVQEIEAGVALATECEEYSQHVADGLNELVRSGDTYDIFERALEIELGRGSTLDNPEKVIRERNYSVLLTTGGPRCELIVWDYPEGARALVKTQWGHGSAIVKLPTESAEAFRATLSVVVSHDSDE
jgi:hypothetical protein